MLTKFFTQFHFLQPAWLLALIPFAYLLWVLWQRRSGGGSSWNKLIDPSLLPFLVVKSEQGQSSKWLVSLFALGSFIAIIALADPAWQRLPQPVYQQPDAQVIVLDLSATMLAEDVKPSRLAQARYKVEDILRKSAGKQTGLVVYAGDAFTVTPLTDDIETLKSQLKVLEPGLMPVQGIRPDLGLKQAGELLQNAGYRHGHIILLADEVGNSPASQVAARLAEKGYQVSVLGIGTTLGAPIPGIKNTNGKPILSRLNDKALAAIAKAGDGKFAPFTSSQADINSILSAAKQSSGKQGLAKNKQNKQAERWVQEGPWLVVLLLPLAAFAFRKGLVLAVVFVVAGQLLTPQPAMALSWDELWQRPDQQAAHALNKGDYKQAAKLAPDPAQRGAAEYRSGNFKKAVTDFKQQKGAQADYNLGNALAKSGQYKKAIEAYDRALKEQPDLQNAKYNRKLVEDLLKKQQAKKKQQQNKQQKPGSKKQKKNQKQSDKKNQNKNGQGKKQPDKKDQKKEGQGKKQSDKKDQKKEGQGKKQSDKKDQKKESQGKKQSDKKDQKKESQGKKQSAKKDQQKADQKQQKTEDKFSKAGDEKQQKKAQQAVSKAAQQALKDKKAKQGKKKTKAQKANMGNKAKDKLNPEQRQSVENWLRRVPDDPGGLLRRKFLYQYQLRQRQQQR